AIRYAHCSPIDAQATSPVSAFRRPPRLWTRWCWNTRESTLVRVNFVIRPLADDEVDGVAAVLGLSRLYQGDGIYLVAWDNGEPLGHAHLALTNPPELQDVSVRPEYRRRGVASALTTAAESEARRRGFDRLRLEVSETNEGALALYE